MSKVERNDYIASIVGLSHVGRKEVARVLDAYFHHVVIASVMPRGAGEYSEPGYFKVTAEKVAAKRVPARNAGEYPNPFKGGVMEHRDAKPASTKPATIKCKLRPQVKLRRAVLGQ